MMETRSQKALPLPHSGEAERAVLGAVLLAPHLLTTVNARLEPPDFHEERHRLIFRAMLDIGRSAGEIDLRTLQGRLEQVGTFERVGGLAFLSGLDLDLPDIGRIETYVELVKERSIRRRLIGSLGGRLSEGLVAGNLIILAGRPRMGKTSLALDVARHVALGKALPVVIFSLEMSRRELTQRVLAAESGLPFSDLRAGRLAERHWARLYSTVRQTRDAPLFVDDSASPSLLEIASKARRLQAEHGLALVVVDYLQLLEGSGSGRRHENRQQEVTALSRGFKVLAKKLGVPVLVLSQLSRKPDERAGKHRPVLSDLRESGAIEQDADMVCFVYREEIYSKDDPEVRGLAELIVEKNRHGPTGTVELIFLGEHTSFRNRLSSPNAITRKPSDDFRQL